VTFGDGRDFVCAMINIDLTAVGNWAERNNIAYGSYQELAAHPLVYDIVGRNVAAMNASLAEEKVMVGAQVRRFMILHKELEADDGELTRTRKVRRGFIAEKYGSLVEAMFQGRNSVHVEAQVKYEDGRSATFAAELKIRDAKTFAPAAARRAA